MLFADSAPWLVQLLVLLSIPALVALNGLFVAAEFSLVAVRKTRVEEMDNQGVKGAKSVLAAVENLDRSIAATQLGITLSSIALGFVGEPALASLIRPLFANFSGVWEGIATHSFAVAIAFVIITFLHVVFGELIPKTVALQIPDRSALWIARPLLIFTWITRPLIITMNGTGNFILKLWGYRPASEESMVHSVEELRLVIEDQQEAGILAPEQAERIQNVLRQDCLHPAIFLKPEETIACALRLFRRAHRPMALVRSDDGVIVGLITLEDVLEEIVGEIEDEQDSARNRN